MHSRDITILIVLLWFSIVCITPACFGTFLSIYYRPYSSWKFLIFLIYCNIDWLINPRIPHHKVLCASIMSESEVQVPIIILCLLCSPHYTAVRIKNSSKSMAVIKVATMWKILWCCVPQLLSESEVSISLLCQLCSTSYTAGTNQELFEKHLCSKSSHYEKHRRFLIAQRKPSRATTKLMLFTVNKDEWNPKEDTGKSLKNALHVLRYAKTHLSGWSNVKQWKNQAGSLSHYQVMLVWRHQAVSQSDS